MRRIEPWPAPLADGYRAAAATGVLPVPALDRAGLPAVIEGFLAEDPAS